ncbi:MAG: hypothetical protein GY756_17795, partial [bacterium]|nr:hypothetical protein [bacterium]
MKKVNEINEKLITVLEEKILLLEDQKAINEEIIEIQKEQLFLSGVSKRSGLLIALLIENIDAFVPDDNFVKMSNCYKKLKAIYGC